MEISLEIEKSVMDLLAILEKDVNNTQSLNSLAEVFVNNNMAVEVALNVLINSFNDPSIDVLHNNLGIAFWGMQEFDYVIPFLQASLAFNPKNMDTLFNLGYVLHIVGENDLALTYLQSIEAKSEDTINLIKEITHIIKPAFFDEYYVKLIDVPNIAKPVCVRMDTTDRYAFQQIFNYHEYQFTGLSFTPRFIIDGGANAGYASVWFANVYPEAKIIAIEPEKSNYEVLKYNTASYQQVDTIHSGLWNKNTYLNTRDVGLGKWGTMVEETDEPNATSLKAITVQSIFEQSGFDEIDILKLDIEGAEREVFSSGYENWLSKVKMIIIELHDNMKRGCSNSFFTAVSKYDFAFTIKGENIILTRGDYFY